MDLFELNITDAERAEIEALRSQNNVARATLWHRIDKGLTQTELAKLAETTQARVSEIEALKGDPKLSTLARVARALGCMIDMVPLPTLGAMASATPGAHVYISATTTTNYESTVYRDRMLTPSQMTV